MLVLLIALASGALGRPQPLSTIAGRAEAPSTAGFSNATIHQSTGGQATCVSGIVSVKASTPDGIKFNYQVPTNESQVTETWLEFVTMGSPFVENLVAGTETISGTYKIGASYCVPANGSTPSAVQVLTHGVGFDRSYWDFAAGYSYVDAAATAGYATFLYDRLSVGESTKPAPLDVQTPIELAILGELVSQLRSGNLSDTSFKTVVGVGHSYGSILTQALTAASPTAIDAAVLTGFSVYEDAMPTFLLGLNLDIASQNQPQRFRGLSNGYLVSNNIISLQTGFFRAPGFAASILSQAEATKGTVTFGELFSSTAVTKAAKQFTGPVAVVNGAEDLPFCFGNCTFKGNLAKQVFPALYPSVPRTMRTTFLAPVAGHGLNFHYSAERAYSFIQAFLKKQGL